MFSSTVSSSPFPNNAQRLNLDFLPNCCELHAMHQDTTKRCRVAVIGAGIVGLFSALEFASHSQFEVVVISETYSIFWENSQDQFEDQKVYVPNLVSDVAAASFIPHSDYSPTIFDILSKSRIFYDQLMDEGGGKSGIRLVEGVEFVNSNDSLKPPWYQDIVFNATKFKMNGKNGWKYSTYLIEPRYMIPFLKSKLESLNVSFERRKVNNLSDDLSYYDIAINCTGQGSKELCKDDDISPVFGQVVVLQGSYYTKWFRDRSHDGDVTYIYPQKNHIICGGTKKNEYQDSAIENQKISEEIMKRVTALDPLISLYPVVSVLSGARPFRRHSFRMELEIPENLLCSIHPITSQNVPIIIHNYGHGGEGYCFAPGCAKAIFEMTTKILKSVQYHDSNPSLQRRPVRAKL